ncbi:uncharacterized protein LOC118182199 isoform X2 [Stegodyphus dumicola]|uniref:uncharacterized protein LOC118182199 isoform X2 n=1 Tax=Stegodyphus dumicola TaxID=202533 RepID=UPI0015ABCC18|nr:uncharacterized protein LOC118182199 isoform X2 [Stegodyphus dumicola]
MRIGSLNLRKSRKSTVFASVRGSARNFGSTSEMFGNRVSTRKKSHKNVVFEKKKQLVVSVGWYIIFIKLPRVEVISTMNVDKFMCSFCAKRMYIALNHFT